MLRPGTSIGGGGGWTARWPLTVTETGPAGLLLGERRTATVTTEAASRGKPLEGLRGKALEGLSGALAA